MNSKKNNSEKKPEKQANFTTIILGGLSGSEKSRVYEAQPITEFCDLNRLSIEERLKLFVQVCEAVQYAHQKGIVHLNLKSSNILVAVQDSKAASKVIDFGKVKVISMPLAEKTIFTQQGQFIGTPEYTSPEQADLNEKDIDTRTDIYSLGIVLYELLVGIRPFEPKTLGEGGYAEVQQIIRDEEPPHPSMKLCSLGENAIKVAKSRHTELPHLVKSLRQGLDWIPLMAIWKGSEQQYKTALDLASDVQNYLDGNPLVAGAKLKAYRIKKYIRMNPVYVTTVALIILVLIIEATYFIFLAVKVEIT